jgi:hypothetical protein
VNILKTIFEIAAWTIIAAIIVLVVMNAQKFAVAISSIDTFVMCSEGVMTGSPGQCQKIK